MWKLIFKSIGEIIGCSIIQPKKAIVVYGGIVKGVLGILLYSLFNFKEVKLGIKKLREKDEKFEQLDNTNYKKIPLDITMPNSMKKSLYLKDSKYIQRDADLIVELSDNLMRISKNYKDFVEKVFNFIQNEISFGINQDESALGTLIEGRGFCYGKLNLMSAILRRQGIATRYKFVPIVIESRIVGFVGNNMNADTQSLLMRMVNGFIPHAVLEVNIDDEWIEADPVLPANLCAFLKYRINSFGDRPIWIEREAENIVYLSEIPALYINALESLSNKKISGYINDTSKEDEREGKKFIEKCGGRESYNRFLLKRYIGV